MSVHAIIIHGTICASMTMALLNCLLNRADESRLVVIWESSKYISRSLCNYIILIACHSARSALIYIIEAARCENMRLKIPPQRISWFKMPRGVMTCQIKIMSLPKLFSSKENNNRIIIYMPLSKCECEFADLIIAI